MLDRMTCSALQKLMENGFSLQDAMDVAENEKAKKVFDILRKKLGEGESIGTVFPPYCPPVYRGYFSGFIRYLSFYDSLTVSIMIAEEEEKRKGELVKGLVYPVILAAGVMTGMLLFSIFVLPQMLRLMEGFRIDCTGYELLRKAILFLSVSGLLITAGLILSAVYFLQPSRIRDTYSFAARRFPDSLMTQYASTEFIRFYLAFMKVNSSTYECMNVLKKMDRRPLVSMIAETLDAELNKGITFEGALHTPYIEKALLRFFRIAFHSRDTGKMLEGYLEMVEERKKRQIRRLTTAVQLVSYTLIGIVIVTIYRVLMIPMTMIQQI